MTVNHNICESCIKVNGKPSIVVADTGICGSCGEFREVWDLEIINLYKKARLSDEMIWKYLPRLRSSHIQSASDFSYSLEDIHLKLKALLSIS